MVEGYLTEKQELLFNAGFYGHWWNFPPYNTREYQNRLKRFMRKYPFVFRANLITTTK